MAAKSYTAEDIGSTIAEVEGEKLGVEKLQEIRNSLQYSAWLLLRLHWHVQLCQHGSVQHSTLLNTSVNATERTQTVSCRASMARFQHLCQHSTARHSTVLNCSVTELCQNCKNKVVFQDTGSSAMVT